LKDIKEDADTGIAALSPQHSIPNEAFFSNHLEASLYVLPYSLFIVTIKEIEAGLYN